VFEIIFIRFRMIKVALILKPPKIILNLHDSGG